MVEESEGDMTKTIVSTTDHDHDEYSIRNLNEEQLQIPIKHIEKVLNNQVILEAITSYNKLSKPYFESSSIDVDSLSKEEQVKYLLETKMLLIPGKRIEKIANLETYVHLEELYLINNLVKSIEGLEYTAKLQVLNLKGNRITKIENISHLTSLQLLDLSDNDIASFDINEVPINIIYAFFFSNPFFDHIDVLSYRSKLIVKCEKIERIDKLDVNDKERLILIEESNLKRNLKGLDYIKEHYTRMVEEMNKRYMQIKDKIKKDYEQVKEKRDKGEGKTIEKESTIMQLGGSSLTQAEIDYQKETQKHIDNMQNFMTNSLLEFQKKTSEYKGKSQERNKRFMESKEVKELRDKLKELNKKFNETTFVDEKVRKKFQERLEKAFGFQDRIFAAEATCKEIIKKHKDALFNNTSIKPRPPLETIEEKPMLSVKEKTNKLMDNSIFTESDMSMLMEELAKEDPPLDDI